MPGIAAHPLPQAAGDVACDPFGERRARRHALHFDLLGGRFGFHSDNPRLLRLVEQAYAGTPPQRLPQTRDFRVELDLLPSGGRACAAPPPLRTHSGAGVLCGILDDRNYVLIVPAERRALVAVSRDMLEHAYHVRYELIEFAVYVLAARGLGLMPLHGACAGSVGRGLLLLGASGAGKSTLALHCLLGGLELLAEDSVFVEPEGLLATGAANFLHLRDSALAHLDPQIGSWIGGSARIRRRSGVEKFEVDLRRGPGRLACEPLRLAATVLLSAETAPPGQPLLERLADEQATIRLSEDQPYAAAQAGWPDFVRRLARQGVYRLRRGAGADASLQAIRGLLE
ncbi:serine kinase [Lysobacter enzymogenes]|uniref:Serine kinase n=1 Tax=Lysobacter enzymogenes TaxID=69 RepID=A0A3N2RI44_LYSEN|nr:serine kinase [Lysobacter enzymogenes]ROU07006.1 serine kinase [Lysobacter enzymogenes]